jgi:hypothetical protein
MSFHVEWHPHVWSDIHPLSFPNWQPCTRLGVAVSQLVVSDYKGFLILGYLLAGLMMCTQHIIIQGWDRGESTNKGKIYMGQIRVWYEWAKRANIPVWGFRKKFQFCSLSEGKPSEVYQKHNNCHFLNMHFNVSDPREGFFIFLVNIPVHIHTQSTYRWYKG